MPNRIKGLLLITLGMMVMGCLFAAWGTSKVVSWVQDLPNRISIDGEAITSAFGTAFTESIHHALKNGDSALQLQIMNEQFLPLIDGNPEAATWVRAEYRSDLLALLTSDDSAVATTASEVIAKLDANVESPLP